MNKQDLQQNQIEILKMKNIFGIKKTKMPVGHI
jgi:hypothetical protein